MRKSRLWAAYIHQDDTDWLELSIKSVIDVVDQIIIIDGGTRDFEKFRNMIDKFDSDKILVVYKKYPGTDFQRNEYLKFIPLNDWVLVLDADEIVSDNTKDVIRDVIKNTDEVAFDIRMHHMIYNFVFEDATREKHYVPRRLFKRTKKLFYPNLKHCVLEGLEKEPIKLDAFQIYHYSLAKGMMKVKKKNDDDMAKERIPQHTDNFLRQWRDSLFFGEYPIKPFNKEKHPRVIREWFMK